MEIQQQSPLQPWPQKINSILFLIVMESEAHYLKEQLNFQLDQTTENDPMIDGYLASLNNIKIYLIIPKKDPYFKIDSFGSECAAVIAQIGITKYNPDLVVSSGTSGGVKRQNGQNIKVGDLCVPKKIFNFTRTNIVKDYFPFTTGIYPILDPTPMHNILGVKIVTIGSQQSFTNDNTLAKSMQIDILEMEAQAISRVAYIHKKPFTCIKIVSDVEQENEDQREKIFLEFLPQGPKKLAEVIIQFINNIDKIK